MMKISGKRPVQSWPLRVSSPGHVCATGNRWYHALGPVDASHVMILRPPVLRPPGFPCLLPLAAIVLTTAFLTVATGALAQERYRSPEDAVAALVKAVRSNALQEMRRVLGPGSDEILRSGDPVDDAATRSRFL